MSEGPSTSDPSVPPSVPLLGDPLPRRRLTAAPAEGGLIKQRPGDFLVEELPLYAARGEGEHLYLRIRKTNVSHSELMGVLRRHYGVRETAIGFAGMKDKLAVTEQTISVHLPGRPEGDPPQHPRILVLDAARHENKLRRGHLAGNHFAIRIRQIDPTRAPSILRQLRALSDGGIPDYFGYQRFGYRRNGHRLGLCVLAEAWEALLAELLGASGSPFPAHQRERREAFDAGRIEESATLWMPGDRPERAAMSALVRGADPRAAVAAIDETTRSFWVSALQSYVFNRVVDRRIDEGALDRLVEGDLAWKHDSRACFAVSAALAEDAATLERLRRFEISPSGPLPGPGMTRPTGRAAAIEAAALAETGLAERHFDHLPFRTQGMRRPLRVQLSNVEAEGGFDEHGPFVRVAFDLPRGAYATVVLRELIGAGAEGAEQEERA
ncbi:MAG TPA: tRNA pseudouridine(13) synthase TruD [Phycisphaerales bacterium]|nr:tRNA pseudouridine(13) synthase TruD [Phycisphaerales bacterium]HMP38169.1 tRNA pseudouridine(13) synthase TruD [Phycisphaerales bacterium]